MENYSAQEYLEMLIMYGEAGRSAYAAARLYAEQYPERRHPDHHVILRCIQRLRETGSVLRNRQYYAPGVQHIPLNMEERILHAFEDNPRNSIRRVARELEITKDMVHRILRQNGLHPYRFQRVHQLLARDEEPRICFCEGFLAQCRRNAHFPDRILWTDEATFTPNGVFNSHNYLLWADENPHAVRQASFQYRWNVNVWAGLKGNRIIGPFFLPPRLTGNIYADFLENELPILLEDVPLRERQELIFQHDGAPAHSSRQVRDILNMRYPDRWMGRGGPIIWPARSPDLNVLDYFFWGLVKEKVEPIRNGNQAEAREAILAAINTITPEMVHRATRDIIRRVEICIRERGRHFEQFLH